MGTLAIRRDADDVWWLDVCCEPYKASSLRAPSNLPQAVARFENRSLVRSFTMDSIFRQKKIGCL